MANDNVLEGMRCPSCGSEEPFRIEVTNLVDVWDNGTELSKYSDTEWSSDAYAECLNEGCSWTGIVDDLYTVKQQQDMVGSSTPREGN